MSDLSFLNPERIHWLWFALGFTGMLWLLERRAQKVLEAFVSSAMLESLARRVSPTRRAARLACILCCGTLAVLALMRPQSAALAAGLGGPEVKAELMVLLDVSRSMLAEDAVPSRLERAKAELRDLLRALPNHRVGLIAFAGRAVVLCPMTTDHSFFRLVLDDAGPSSVSRGGTRIAAGLEKAMRGFTPGPSAKLLVLVTDGEDHDGYAEEAATEAAALGARIVAIGFGDEGGSALRITDPLTGARETIKDRSGKVVRSRLDGETLRKLTQATRGIYVPAGVGVLDLESIVARHLEPLIDGGQQRSAPARQERARPFIIAALLALVASALFGTRRRKEPS